MKQLFAIALLQTRLMVRNIGTLLMMFVMPLTLIAAFALFGGGTSQPKPFPLAVIDADKGFVSARLVEALRQDASLRIQVAAGDEIQPLMASHKISGGVLIPAGFQEAIESGRQPELEVITAPDSSLQLTAEPAIARAVSVVANNYTMALSLAAGSNDPAQLQAAYETVVQERTRLKVGVDSMPDSTALHARDQIQERAMGFTVMFVMITVLMMAGVILQERRAGTWGRILTTPTDRPAVLGGYLLSCFLTGALQFGVLVGASALLFRVTWGPWLQLSVVAFAVIFCATGIGLFLAGIVRTAEQQRIFGLSFVVITSMLGGVYWPLDVMGDTMQKIGHLTPQAWALDGLRTVMLRGAGWGQLAIPVTVLMALAVVLTGASLLRIQAE